MEFIRHFAYNLFHINQLVSHCLGMNIAVIFRENMKIFVYHIGLSEPAGCMQSMREG